MSFIWYNIQNMSENFLRNGTVCVAGGVQLFSDASRFWYFWAWWRHKCNEQIWCFSCISRLKLLTWVRCVKYVQKIWNMYNMYATFLFKNCMNINQNDPFWHFMVDLWCRAPKQSILVFGVCEMHLNSTVCCYFLNFLKNKSNKFKHMIYLYLNTCI